MNQNILNTDEILDLITESSSLGCRQLTITGGEPTLRKDLATIIPAAKNNNLRVSLLSNGVSLSSEYLDFLSRNGLTKLSISIDSPHPHIHNDIRGIKDAFQKSITIATKGASLRRSNTDLREVMIATCLLKSNLHDLLDMVTLVARSGADTLSLITIDPHNDEGHELNLNRKEKLFFQSELIPKLKKMCLESNIKLRTSGISEHYGLNPSIELTGLPCYFVWSNITISPNGNVYPCCDLVDNPNALLGSIKKNSLSDIITSPQAANIRLLMKERNLPECRKCYWENAYNRRIHGMFSKYSHRIHSIGV